MRLYLVPHPVCRGILQPPTNLYSIKNGWTDINDCDIGEDDNTEFVDIKLKNINLEHFFFQGIE